MAVLLLLHVPPDGLLDTVAVLPIHKVESPVIVAGRLFTVTTAVRKQPELLIYEICVVPFDIPVTLPVVPTVATLGVALTHVPPAGAELRAITPPTHIAELPVMTEGRLFTVILLVVLQPDGSVYVIAAIPPVTPVPEPDVESIVRTDDVPDVQIPPVGEEV
jgi:hypothetical protein